MSGARAWIVVDLGFGDAGKGTVVDFIARSRPVRHVVRSHGGAQAGHNVVTDDGRHHRFAQLGAATLVPGVRTHHGPHMVVHPAALLREAEALGKLGVRDALERLTIDGRALVTTPYDQALVRLRERSRAFLGEPVHGTCGVGVGETVWLSLDAPELAVRAEHLWRPAGLVRRLATIRDRALGIARSLPLDPEDGPTRAEWALLESPRVIDDWIASLAPLVRRQVLVDGSHLDDVLRGPDEVIFEGAQGVLLDEWRGFHPHTTWSTCTTARPLELLAGHGREVVRLGVSRTYQTRHGAGPMPSCDPRDRTPEPHNDESGWQGAFRRGPLDLVLLRYALEVCPVDALAVTHCDVARPEVVARYWEGERAIERLPVGGDRDLEHQAALTRLLERVEVERVATADAVETLREAAGVPIVLRSYGPRAEDKVWGDGREQTAKLRRNLV